MILAIFYGIALILVGVFVFVCLSMMKYRFEHDRTMTIIFFCAILIALNIIFTTTALSTTLMYATEETSK